MRFLVDASLPRAIGRMLRSRGHQATDTRDVNLGEARNPIIAEYARRHDLAIVTADFDFADVRNYPPGEYAGIVVIHPMSGSSIAQIVALLESFIDDGQSLSRLEGRLAIIEPARIRLRPD